MIKILGVILVSLLMSACSNLSATSDGTINNYVPGPYSNYIFFIFMHSFTKNRKRQKVALCDKTNDKNIADYLSVSVISRIFSCASTAQHIVPLL